MTQTSVAQDIAIWLGDNSSATLGTDLFAFELSQDAEKQAVILDTGGFQLDLPETIEQVTIQLFIRGNKKQLFADIYTFARELHEVLISNDITANSNEYGRFFPSGQSAPELLGRDKDDRPILSCNYFSYRNPFS